MLESDGSALDAVCEAIRVLEDDERFNAGRGSVLTRAGTVQMDACVSCGATRRAAGVGAIENVRHPVDAARIVMDQSTHALLVGRDATDFVRHRGVELRNLDWFVTEERSRQLEAFSETDPASAPASAFAETVGALALDSAGHLAAGTSTGGILGSLCGRVGDSAVPGVACWADDETCALVVTGDGDPVLRSGFAARVDALVRSGTVLREACRQAWSVVAAIGGRGASIALSPRGEVVVVCEAATLEWAAATASGVETRISDQR